MQKRNARGLKDKLFVLQSEALLLRKYVLIAMTAIWLNDDVATAELPVGLENHAALKDRDGGVGGGVAIDVRTELMPQLRADLETNSEYVVVQIGVLHGRSCLVACMCIGHQIIISFYRGHFRCFTLMS